MLSHQTYVRHPITNKLNPINKQALWPYILHRQSDRRSSEKFVTTFADRGRCVFSTTDPYRRILGFLDLNR
jgi:hypothetical protein